MLSNNGFVYACGSNSYGGLGLGHKKDLSKLELVWSPESGSAFPLQVAVGCYHSAIRFEDGSLLMCGRNDDGQLVLGDRRDRQTFTPVPQRSDVNQVVLGGRHTIVLTEGGNVLAGGSGRYGQLGNGSTEASSQLVLIDWSSEHHTGVGLATSISAGPHQSFCIFEDGSVFAWGRNSKRELGVGHSERVVRPEKMKLPSSSESMPIQVACGGRNKFNRLPSALKSSPDVLTVVLMDIGTVFACGSLEGFGLPTSQGTINSTDPLKITPLGNVCRVAVGGSHAQFLTLDNRIAFCGRYDHRKDTKGSLDDVTWLKLPSGQAALDITSGMDHSFVRTVPDPAWDQKDDSTTPEAEQLEAAKDTAMVVLCRLHVSVGPCVTVSLTPSRVNSNERPSFTSFAGRLKHDINTWGTYNERRALESIHNAAASINLEVVGKILRPPQSPADLRTNIESALRIKDASEGASKLAEAFQSFEYAFVESQTSAEQTGVKALGADDIIPAIALAFYKKSTDPSLSAIEAFRFIPLLDDDSFLELIPYPLTADELKQAESFHEACESNGNGRDAHHTATIVGLAQMAQRSHVQVARENNMARLVTQSPLRAQQVKDDAETVIRDLEQFSNELAKMEQHLKKLLGGAEVQQYIMRPNKGIGAGAQVAGFTLLFFPPLAPIAGGLLLGGAAWSLLTAGGGFYQSTTAKQQVKDQAANIKKKQVAIQLQVEQFWKTLPNASGFNAEGDDLVGYRALDAIPHVAMGFSHGASAALLVATRGGLFGLNSMTSSAASAGAAGAAGVAGGLAVASAATGGAGMGISVLDFAYTCVTKSPSRKNFKKLLQYVQTLKEGYYQQRLAQVRSIHSIPSLVEIKGLIDYEEYSRAPDKECIGKGGFGSVFHVQNLPSLPGGPFAVKIFHPRQEGDGTKDEYEVRVNFEMQVMWALGRKSPHLMSLAGYMMDSSSMVGIVMPKMAHSLQALLYHQDVQAELQYRPEHSTPCDSLMLSPQDRLDIILGVIEGLMCLHDAKVLHLDVKPQNILLDDFKAPKLADFGLAKHRIQPTLAKNGESLSRISTGSTMFGTTGFIDPLILQTGNVSEMNDGFSLGITALLTLTGLRLTPNQQIREKCSHIIHSPNPADVNEWCEQGKPGADPKCAPWPDDYAKALAEIVSKLTCEFGPNRWNLEQAKERLIAFRSPAAERRASQP